MILCQLPEKLVHQTTSVHVHYGGKKPQYRASSSKVVAVHTYVGTDLIRHLTNFWVPILGAKMLNGQIPVVSAPIAASKGSFESTRGDF